MGARSEIYEAVAAAPVRKTMFFAAALLGLLVIFGASGDTVFAKGPMGEFSATATIFSIDAGDVTAAGASERFVVKNRIVGGVADGDLFGAFSATFGTNVPISSQSGNIHGNLLLGGNFVGNFAYGAKFVAKSSVIAVSFETDLINVVTVDPFTGIPTFGPPGRAVGLSIDGKMTFTSGTQGHGTILGTFWVIVDTDGHIIGGALPGQEFTNIAPPVPVPDQFTGSSTLGMSGNWHQ